MKVNVLAAALVFCGISTAAHATCRIKNETKYSFVIESGNVSNQSIGSRTQSTIAAGKVKAKGTEGKSFSAQCADGQQLTVKESGDSVTVSVD